jgi:selenocysteine lyase/cysteine desulfurase
VELVTPAEKNLSCGIASFRMQHKTSAEVADHLFKQHNILTVNRALGKEGCVRVTPSVYNSAADIKKLVEAVRLIK